MSKFATPLVFIAMGVLLTQFGHMRRHFTAVPKEQQRRFGPGFALGVLWIALGLYAIYYQLFRARQ